MTITLHRADLDFLLRQVTVNYLVPDPNNPGQFIGSDYFNYSALANAVDPSGLREVSGFNNNLVGGHWDPTILNPLTNEFGVWVPGPNSNWGQSSQPFLNLSVGQADSSAPVSGVDGYNSVGTLAAPGRAVTDSAPRLISNLVASSITDPTSQLYNPAAAAAATNVNAGSQFEGLQFNGQDTAFVANAGVLGGGRYNGWFVSFGQFFDHGLDFVNRDPDPTDTVTVTLSSNDPLYDADGANNILGDFDDVTSIRIRRADVANVAEAGGDGIFGTSDDNGYSDNGTPLDLTDDTFAHARYVNQTGLLIDQSQTYGSHQSVNALIREYTPDGHPTGRVVTGNTDVLDTPNPADDGDAVGLATWADIKTNALRIGIELIDPGINPGSGSFTSALNDLTNAPVLRVDPVGKLLFTPDGGTAWRSDSIVIGPQAADDPFMRNADGTVMRTGQNMLLDFNLFIDTDFSTPGVQIDLVQALNSHIITGDGRGNENMGLTAVHHVFHEEHNAQVVNVKTSIEAEAATILANEGQPAADAFLAQWQTSPGVWDGEKLYQAARIITESEYNHIAIDQYVGTLYGALPEFVSYSSDINMGVSLEFSQAVFRLGHSMLTETFNVTNPNTGQDLKLLDMFLNPTLYRQMLDANGNPTDLVRGLTTTLGNEVDEFVTPALQQSLLGQPLDLATINIARGREVGLPTWNEFRQQIYDQLIQNTNNTNGSALAPYTSWADVVDHLKSPLTGVNFIAAYARDTGDVWGIENARADYQAGGPTTLQDIRDKAQALYDAYLDPLSTDHDAAVTFMQGDPTYDPGTGGWTFPGADQGFWDIDLWIGGLAERPLFDGPLGTTFSYVILDFAQRQQDGDRFYYLFRTPMGTNLGNEIIQNQFGNLVKEHTGLEHLNGEIFIWANATYELDGVDIDGAGPDVGLTDVDSNADLNDYFNAATQTILDVDGTPMQASLGHLIIAGNEGHDFIIAGLGDDTVYGDDGDDTIQGNQGNDHLFGGEGNDLITDDENDDFISGGGGNDRIFAGGGVLDTVFGDEGDDELHGGDGIDEVLGGTGDDMIYGDGDTDVLFGDDGNDYIDGGDSVDEMQGQAGNDWMRGGVGDDHLIGGDGNDLMEGGLGPTANDGDRLLGQGVIDFAPAGTVEVDLGFDVASYEDVDITITANLHTSNQNGTGGLLDTYAGIEGLVGTRFNDNLTGAGTDTATNNGFDNLLVGGSGNDVLVGLGGDDQIFGDSVVVRNELGVHLGPASDYTTVTNWKGTGEDRPDFDLGAGFDLGHFLGDNGAAGSADLAVFSGQRSDYTRIEIDATTVRLIDNRGIDSTAVGDTIKDVELFQFSDGVITLAQLLNDAPTDIQWNGRTPPDGSLPAAGAIIADLATVDPDNVAGFTYSLQSFTAATGGFAVSATGEVTRTGAPMASNQSYTLTIRSTDALGAFFDETFTIRTNGTGNSSNLGTFATAGDNVLYGNTGNDTNVNGLAGNDTLFGQAGSDALNGGDGNDLINGGSGTDTASYAGAAGAVAVSLATAGQQNTGGAGLDTLVGIENLIGSSFGDNLTGVAGANNTLTGGGGDDTFTVHDTGDVVSEAGGTGGGIDTVLSVANTYTIGDGDVENLTFVGTGGFTGTGNGSANVVTGGNSAAEVDVLNGGGGADTLLGLAGIDSVNGGGGADTLIGGAGNDIMNGNADDDTFVFAAGFGNDVINSFDANPGGGGQDLLDISAYGYTAADVGATTAFAVQVQDLGSNTLITIDTDTILLIGVNGSGANVIDHNDFIF